MKNYLNNISYNKGFSLLEVLLAVVIVSAILSAGTLAGYRMLLSSELRNAEILARAALVEARTRSQAMLLDKSWGVQATSTHFVVFAGDYYSQRDPKNDQIFILGRFVEISTSTDLYFNAVTGRTDKEALFVLKNSAGEITLKVNRYGFVSN